MKILSEYTPIPMTLGFIVIALGGFGSFLWLQFKVEANSTTIQDLQSAHESDRQILMRIQLDVAEMKGDIKGMRKELK